MGKAKHTKRTKCDPVDSPGPSPSETPAVAKLIDLFQRFAQELPPVLGPFLDESRKDKEDRKFRELRERCTLAALTGLCANTQYLGVKLPLSVVRVGSETRVQQLGEDIRSRLGEDAKNIGEMMAKVLMPRLVPYKEG